MPCLCESRWERNSKITITFNITIRHYFLNSVHYEVRLFAPPSFFLLFFEANGLSREEIDITPKKLKCQIRAIIHCKYHKWDYISSPYLLLEENQVQENHSLIYGLIYKILRRQQKINIHLWWKGEELHMRAGAPPNAAHTFWITKCW